MRAVSIIAPRRSWTVPATLLALCLATAGPLPAQAADRDALQAAVQSDQRPIVLYVAGKGTPAPFAVTRAATDGKPALGPDAPVRIASNTKTFVAATVLRLWEQGRIDLDAAIGPLLTPALDKLLLSGGYDTSRITVRQLLSHSAGIYDHASDKRYLPLILAEPKHHWTREEQVRLAVEWGRPLGEPGKAFHYSDTGYILVGDIIERVTGQSLAKAVREQLQLDRLHLGSTWWEILEDRPATAPERARQFIGDRDMTDVSGTVDLYGGGGMVMSARDLATLTAALFEGRLFARPDTLAQMLWRGPHEGAEGYRLGVFVREAGGRTAYWHGGFWGTVAWYVPATGVAVAGVTTNQDAYGRVNALAGQAAGMPTP